MARTATPIREQRTPNRKKRTDSDSEETLLHAHEIAPVLNGPEMRHPANVLALQRTFGNQAAMKILQRAASKTIQRDPPEDDTDDQPENLDNEIIDDQSGENLDGDVSEEINDNPQPENSEGLGDVGTESSGISGSGTQILNGGSLPSAPNAPKFRRNKPDKLKDQDKQFGLYQGYKTGKKIKGATTGIIENSGNTTEVVAQTAQQYGDQFSGAANAVADAAAGGSVLALQTALSGFVGVFMPYFKLIKLAVKIPLSIKKTHKTRQNMVALKSAYQSSKSKAAEGDSVAQVVYESAKYGFRKVRRQFAERIAKIIIAIVKFATIITELVTGGTAILFTSIGKLLTGVSKGIITGIAAAKSLYKSIKGTKGVNRRLNSEALITAANDGNPEALHLLYKMKIGKSLWMRQNGIAKSKNPFKKEVEFFKKDEVGYRAWLMGLTSKEWGKLRSELARKLRSTTTKTFTEKRRSMGV